MPDLKTKYMGLELRNPLMVASCGLSGTLDGIIQAADSGAGAVVLKSIFEEQIDVEVDDLTQNTWLPGHPEAVDYLRQTGYALGPNKYLDFITESKKAVPIPVFASLNCVSPRWWVDYARKIEDAGADGLELNISVRPSDPKRTAREVEKIYFDIIESVKPKIKIPVAVKIGPYFTSLGNIAKELANRGADAIVLFNRFYKLDIDIDKMQLKPGYPFSNPEEIERTLRWVALLAGRINADIAASTGIHDAAGVVKQLLAGASVVEMCSALYKQGISFLRNVIEGLEEWMKRHNFSKVEEFRGRLSQEESDNPELYERLQYIKAVVGIE